MVSQCVVLCWVGGCSLCAFLLGFGHPHSLKPLISGSFLMFGDLLISWFPIRRLYDGGLGEVLVFLFALVVNVPCVGFLRWFSKPERVCYKNPKESDSFNPKGSGYGRTELIP